MEVTMYEDGSSYGNLGRDNPAQMKRKFTLDLNGRSKRMRFAAPPHLNSMLTSPDLNMLKLASPELDQMVLQQSGLLPGGFNFSAAVIAATKAATPTAPSQEEFVKGFQDTLDQMHNKSVVTTAVTSSEPVMALSHPTVTAALQYTQLEPPRTQAHHTFPRVISDHTSIAFSEDASTDPLYIKEEPQMVPSACGTPPLSPIDMEDQERIKLERKRLRNRVAASKCRRRKLERIGRLEDKVAGLKADNSELQLIVNRLRDQVYTLKEEVMEHVHAGCQIAFMTNQ